MKVTSLNGASLNFDHGLNKINSIIYEILSELGVTVSEIKLDEIRLPYYEGAKFAASENIVREIKESNGLIFTATSTLGSPSALLQTFMEHLDYIEFRDAISKKNCLIMIVSDEKGERQALDHISRSINLLGGFDSVKICLNGRHLRNQDLDPAIQEIIEKQVEDFYRIVRQNRKYIIPDTGFYFETQAFIPPENAVRLTAEEQQRIQHIEQKKKIPISNLYEELETLNKRQEHDISEITQFFATKYTESQNDQRSNPSFEPAPPAKVFNSAAPPVPRTRTVKQYTAALPHHFNPQLAGGLNACIQLSINGSEKFDGYLIINNIECSYLDGIAENPDITILSDSAVWMGVLKGKYTAQKSFMIGQLKVRGNFVLLSKFDQLFKTMQ